MSKLILIIFGWFALGMPAQAASFDCGKATTKVEKLICADAALSKLDEELSATYKTALQDEKQAEIIRHTQQQWLKERNGCPDVACVMHAYEMRLASLAPSEDKQVTRQDIAPLVSTPSHRPNNQHGMSGKKAIPNSETADYTYKLTKDKGWNICRAYVKNLEAVQPTKASLACEVKLDPNMRQFSRPKWEELNIEDHWDVVYFIETELEKSFSKKIPPFNVWRASYRSRIQSGEIKPRLRQTSLKYASDDPAQIFFAYTRNRDDIEVCKKEIAAGQYTMLAKYTGNYFIYYAPFSKTYQLIDPYGMVENMFWPTFKSRVVLYNSTMFLQFSAPVRNGYVMDLYNVLPIVPGKGAGYIAQPICEIEAHVNSTSHQ